MSKLTIYILVAISFVAVIGAVLLYPDWQSENQQKRRLQSNISEQLRVNQRVRTLTNDLETVSDQLETIDPSWYREKSDIELLLEILGWELFQSLFTGDWDSLPDDVLEEFDERKKQQQERIDAIAELMNRQSQLMDDRSTLYDKLDQLIEEEQQLTVALEISPSVISPQQYIIGVTTTILIPFLIELFGKHKASRFL